METMVVDAELRARLRDLTVPLELLDEDGNILGCYTPLFRPANADELMKTCPYTDEQLEQFGNEPGGRTLTEIWQRLERTE